jgi:hypothetical protein
MARSWLSAAIVPGATNNQSACEDGLQEQAPIVAARHIETDEGHLLILWLRLADEGIELQFGYDDDLGDSEDGDSDFTDWSI